MTDDVRSRAELNYLLQRKTVSAVKEIVINRARAIFEGDLDVVVGEIVSMLTSELHFVIPRETRESVVKAFIREFLLKNATGLLTRGQESQVYWRLISNLVRQFDFRPQEELR